MKKLYILLIVLMFVNLAFGQQKIAIYVTGGEDDGIDKVLRQQLMSALNRNRDKYIPVERQITYIDIVKNEMCYQQSGFVDDNDIVCVGKQLGAELVCIGEISKLFGNIVISARFVDVVTVEIKAIESLTVQKISPTATDVIERCKTLAAIMVGEIKDEKTADEKTREAQKLAEQQLKEKQELEKQKVIEEQKSAEQKTNYQNEIIVKTEKTKSNFVGTGVGIGNGYGSMGIKIFSKLTKGFGLGASIGYRMFPVSLPIIIHETVTETNQLSAKEAGVPFTSKTLQELSYTAGMYFFFEKNIYMTVEFAQLGKFISVIDNIKKPVYGYYTNIGGFIPLGKSPISINIAGGMGLFWGKDRTLIDFYSSGHDSFLGLNLGLDLGICYRFLY